MAPLVDSGKDVNRISVWQCIGCGRVELPQPCIGVCSDRKVEFVASVDFDELQRRFRELEGEYQRLVEFMRMMARNTPKPGHWEASYKNLQASVEKRLESLDGR